MSNSLRVAYYLQRFPHLTETFILREMLFLRKMGLDIQVFSLLPPVPTPTMHQEVQEMMPYVHYSPYLFSTKIILAQLYFFLRSPFKYFRAFWRIIWQTWPEPLDFLKAISIFPKSVFFAKQLQEMKIDHIHAHFIWTNAIAAQVASDLIGITYSLHAHAWDIFQRNQECVRRQLKLATALVTVSSYHRHYLAGLCPCWKPENIKVVHYGLNPAEFLFEPSREGNQTVRILSVGSLVGKKGHDDLIDACSLLVGKGYKFHCTIVGNGPLRDTLQAHIDRNHLQDYVLLAGPKNQNEVKDLYCQSNIFALACVIDRSGDRDGMPNVLLEAMAMEIPVVTTPVTGNTELVIDNENGLLVPERDPQALAAAIERLINDPVLRERLGKQGRQTILSGFDIQQTSNQMAMIFRQIKNGTFFSV